MQCLQSASLPACLAALPSYLALTAGVEGQDIGVEDGMHGSGENFDPSKTPPCVQVHGGVLYTLGGSGEGKEL
jgi:hypothetical protein